MAFSVGDTLQAGKYRLDALREERPWGMTFLATHLSVDQPVLIKTFQATDTAEGPSQTQVDSFIHYAQKLTRFHHPQLARVSNAFTEHQCACMVSEFVQGTPLHHLSSKAPLTEAIALQFIIQVVQGLHALHRHGLLHLNLRPSRILQRQEEGGIVLIGLNSRFSNHPDETAGKPYLAPEQTQSSQTIGIPSEIYGLSATLYTLVTGKVPIAAGDRNTTPLTRPRQHNSDLSQAIEDAILRGLALDSHDRPQSLKSWLKMLPTSSAVAAPKTKLQVPASWKVKLPAFRDAGFKNPVSTVITPDSSSLSTEPPTLDIAPQTTLQASVPDPPAKSNESAPAISGHPELDSLLTELTADSPRPAPPQTTLQVNTEPLVQSEVTSSESQSAPSLVETPAVLEQSVAPVANAIPLQSPSEEPPASPQAEPEPVRVEASPLMQAETPDMTTTLPKHSSRFPKWTLFWCALVAACGGLGAGLWFRVQLAQQFATPAAPAQESPLDRLRSLDTKQEEFLPTQSSVIPEEQPDPNQPAETYDPNQPADLELAPSYDAVEPDTDWQGNPDPDPAGEESTPWDTRDRARARLSSEQSDPDFPASEELETFDTNRPEEQEPRSYEDGVTPNFEADTAEESLTPLPSEDELQTDRFTSTYDPVDSNPNPF